jgi:hypothetical protein
MNTKGVTTKLPTRDEIQSVIDTGDPAAFIRFEEASCFEVRERSYATDSPDKVSRDKALQTLTTDVSSLANSGGGYLVIGLKTTTKAGLPTEYVSSVCGVDKDQVPLDKWRQVIRQYTTPRLTLEAIEHGFIGKDKLVFWMKIPNAKSTGEYPVLVTKAKWQVDDEAYLHGDLYGLYHRDGAENLLETPEKIQKMLSVALTSGSEQQNVSTAQYQRLSEQLESLAATIGAMGNSDSRIGAEVASKIDEADTKLHTDQGYFYVYARPQKPMQFARFWDSDSIEKTTVYGMVKHPPTLRRLGWSLEVAASEYPQPNGNEWEIRNGNRKLLQVSDTGAVFGAITVAGVLNHGAADHLLAVTNGGINALVNELALTEYIYNFSVFTDTLARERGKILDYDLVYGFNVPEGVELGLLRSAGIAVLSYDLSDNRLGKTREWHGLLEMGVPLAMQAANIVLNIIRAGFGITEDPPFITKNDHGYLAVDTEFYKNIGK